MLSSGTMNGPPHDETEGRTPRGRAAMQFKESSNPDWCEDKNRSVTNVRNDESADRGAMDRMGPNNMSVRTLGTSEYTATGREVSERMDKRAAAVHLFLQITREAYRCGGEAPGHTAWSSVDDTEMKIIHA